MTRKTAYTTAGINVNIKTDIKFFFIFFTGMSPQLVESVLVLGCRPVRPAALRMND